MHFQHPQTHLREQLQDDSLRHQLPVLALEELFQVPTLGVLHHDAQFVPSGLVDFLERDDVGVTQHAVELGLSEGSFPLLCLKVPKVDALHDVEPALLHALYQVGSAHSSLSKNLDLAVFFALDGLSGDDAAVLHQ